MHKLILSCIIILFTCSLQSQSGTDRREYATNNYLRHIKSQDTNYTTKKTQLDRHIKRFDRYGRNTKHSLPVIFHIMYTEDITSAVQQVAVQIEALNRDFGFRERERVHSRFSRLGDDSEISFYAAPTREQALTGSGVSTVGDYGDWSVFDRMKNSRSRGVTAWDTEKYINVWVVKMSGDLKSYAQFPIGPSDTDGIVIDYRHFGQQGQRQYPYNKGKTLTHLMGSYLGLYELWGISRCKDDEVRDTPVHNIANIGKYGGIYSLTGSGSGNPPLRRNVLREEYPIEQHITTCKGNAEEMTVNFMDASDDASQGMFTKGQIRRMQAILSPGGPRAILSSQNQTR